MSTAVAVVGESCTPHGPANETTVGQPSVSRSVFCHHCDCPIPTNRLRANPKATSCVPCLEAAGDVAPLRRLDEGEEQTMFYAGDSRMERAARQRITRARIGLSSSVMDDETESPKITKKQFRSHEQMVKEIDSIAYDKEN